MTLFSRLLQLLPLILLLISVLFWEEFKELFFTSGVHYIGLEGEDSEDLHQNNDNLISWRPSETDDDAIEFDTAPSTAMTNNVSGTSSLRGQGQVITTTTTSNAKQTENSKAISPLPKNYHGNSNETFCVDWKIDSDLWWTHHPEWTISDENQTHYCFSKIQNQNKASLYRRIYNLNYNNNGDCSNVKYLALGSRGWGADVSVVNDGLFNAIDSETPVQIYAKNNKPWHYAAKKDGSHPACPRMDMSCYFLNISSCNTAPGNKRRIESSLLRRTSTGSTNSTETTKSLAPNDFPGIEPPDAAARTEKQQKWWWICDYATRPQTWLRRDVYAMTQKVPIAKKEEKNTRPCVAMHVRRGDVILERSWKRKYYDIDEYVEAFHKHRNSTPSHHGEQPLDEILLLTDDQNAIDEALQKYNNKSYHWMYLDRQRFKGASGGYENQIPSDDPIKEVVAIRSAFRLIRQCNILIHTQSHFSDYLYHEMVEHYDGETIRINLDKKIK